MKRAIPRKFNRNLKIFEKKIAEKGHSVFIKFKKKLGNGDLYYHY